MLLFPADMFTVTVEFTGGGHTSVRERAIAEAVELGLELVSTEDWADALDLMREFIPGAATAERPLPIQQTLMALAALCESRLAIAELRWSAAADWLLTGLARCSPENEPALEQPLANQYLLVCAAMAGGGERVLSYEPSQLHVLLDEDAFHNLSLAYVRLSPFGDVRLRQAIRNVPTLRNRILDHLWQDREAARGRRKGQMDIVELVLQDSIALFQSVREYSQQIMQRDSLAMLRDPATSLIRVLSQDRRLFLTDEVKTADAMRDTLGRELGLLMKTHEILDPVEKKENLYRFQQNAASVMWLLERGGLFARCLCLPLIRHLHDIAVREMGFTQAAVVPDLRLKQRKKRYPLDQVGETLRLQIEIVNQGKGTAEQCYVEFTLPHGTPLVVMKPMPFNAPSIPSGGSHSLECPVRVVAPVDTLAIPMRIGCTDVFGNCLTFEDVLVVERQREEPDWEALLEAQPYALTPTSSLKSLRGRAAILDILRVNVAVGTSTVLWGQKRVGKTSIATVFHNEVVDRRRCLPVYVRRGDIAGYSEGQIARVIAAKISAAVPQLELTVPDEAWFGPTLTRLTDWIAGARSRGLSQKLLVILDEFDEIPAIYLGERGANFFATVRSLSEQQVVWLFVGSERMQNIFLRHHAILNQVEVHRVDRVADPQDIEDMIVGPVRGMIDWDPEAVELVRQLSAGNPYYVNLICSRILKEMYRARRTFVDRADVVVAAKAIASEASPTHWGHFWEDNAELDPVDRNRCAASSALALAAIGVSGGSEPVSRLGIKRILESLELDEEDIVSAIDTLPSLVQRGVIEEIRVGADVRYQVVVPLFREFLSQHGRSLVLSEYEHYARMARELAVVSTPARAVVIVPADPFPVDEEELLAISEGLVYQGVPVDAVRIKAWLRQFPDDAAIVMAAKLLRRLKERYYLDLRKVRHAIDDVYAWLIDQMRSSGVEALEIAPGRAGRIANVHVAYLGPPSKSGADIAREFKNQKRFARCASVDEALNWVTKDVSIDPERKFVLIVDDFLGTGETAKEGLLTMVNRLRKDPALMSWAEAGRILFAPLWAFAEGLDAVRREVGDLVRIQPARNLGDEDRAFWPGSDLFANEDERRYAEQVFRHIGQQLLRDHPLGWGNCQALVVFENTVPNNTLPPFWCSGTVDEKPWKPLFQRP